MRFCSPAFLGTILVLVVSFSAHGATTTAQSVQISTAQNQLSIAFIAVQQADEQGVSQDQVSQLAANLNIALSYLENATALSTKDPSSSNSYANKSSTLSSSITNQALSQTTAARNQLLLTQVGIYSLALIGALVMASIILEFHRIRDLVRKMGFRRPRFN